jgi:hypothetical protein
MKKVYSSKGWLKFSDANAKLRALRTKGIYAKTISLPAGWTCPGASLCKAKVGRQGGLTNTNSDLPLAFQCFAANEENQYEDTRRQRWHNFDLLKKHLNDSAAMADLISRSLLTLPAKTNVIRIHVSGDFFNQAYFLAWCEVAKRNPSLIFYAYTKSIRTWIDNRASVPANLIITASYGGLWDGLIQKHNLRSAIVVFSIEEASRLGLEIDHDDSHAFDPKCHQFALLIHSVQPKGSRAAEALKALKGLSSYSPKTKVNQARAKAVSERLAA